MNYDGWVWMDLDGFGWIWMDLDGFGWVWMGLGYTNITFAVRPIRPAKPCPAAVSPTAAGGHSPVAIPNSCIQVNPSGI